MSFDCPHCKAGPERVRLAVAFSNPIDGGAVVSLSPRNLWPLLWPDAETAAKVTVPPGVHWTREGDTFETLTIKPSVDASASGHWHGFVTAGEAA